MSETTGSGRAGAEGDTVTNDEASSFPRAATFSHTFSPGDREEVRSKGKAVVVGRCEGSGVGQEGSWVAIMNYYFATILSDDRSIVVHKN